MAKAVFVYQSESELRVKENPVVVSYHCHFRTPYVCSSRNRHILPFQAYSKMVVLIDILENVYKPILNQLHFVS